jgi:hypothetical protein
VAGRSARIHLVKRIYAQRDGPISPAPRAHAAQSRLAHARRLPWCWQLDGGRDSMAGATSSRASGEQDDVRRSGQTLSRDALRLPRSVADGQREFRLPARGVALSPALAKRRQLSAGWLAPETCGNRRADDLLVRGLPKMNGLGILQEWM